MFTKTIAAGGVAGIALALAAVAVPAQAAPLGDWDFSDTRITGHAARTAEGLHIWTEGSTSTDKVAGYLDVDLPLASTLTGGVDYTATIDGAAPGAQFVVDIDGDGTADGILVGERVYGENWWLSNSSTAAFKALDPSGAEDGGNGSAYFGTLAQWAAAAPAARIVKVGFSLGSGVHGDGVVHAVVAGGTRYTFDGYTLSSCATPVTLAAVTAAELGSWTVKPGTTPTWQDGAVRLAATDSGSAWVKLALPAGTDLSELSRLAANGERSGIWWGGIILEGGDLTAQLHFDDDGRFWTDQKGIFPAASLKGGYYESRDLAADLESDPEIGSIKVYVNAGANSITLTSVDYGCSTQPFTAKVDAAPEEPEAAEPSLTADVATIVAGGTVTLTGADFPSRAAVAFELRSTPVELGSVVADEDGALAFAAVVPASTPAGDHEIVAILEDGTELSVPLTVTAPVGSGSGSTPAAGDSTDTAAAGLADTGFESTGLALGGLAALLLGAGALVAMSVRRRAAGARG